MPQGRPPSERNVILSAIHEVAKKQKGPHDGDPSLETPLTRSYESALKSQSNRQTKYILIVEHVIHGPLVIIRPQEVYLANRDGQHSPASGM